MSSFACLENLLVNEQDNTNKRKNILVVIDQFKQNGPIWQSLGGKHLDNVIGLFADKGAIELSEIPNLDKGICNKLRDLRYYFK